jgi:hypothetical protein
MMATLAGLRLNTKWQFGMILTADYVPEMRLMVLGPVDSAYRTSRDRWNVMCLRDDTDPAEASAWLPGEVFTLSPSDAGLRIVASPEETE